jgi:hypothetical protein
MKSEEIILLVFVCFITIGIPVFLWFLNKEQKRQEEEEWNRNRKK